MKKITNQFDSSTREVKFPNHPSKILFTLCVCFLSFFSVNLYGQWPGNAPVNPPADSFRTDGTLKVTNHLGDWLQGTTGTGGYVLQQTAGVWGAVNASTTTFVRDTFNHTSDKIFTGSSFSDNPNTWKWTTGKPTSKCDIATAMYHVSSSPTSKWIILGGDRYTTQGTSYIDFEFNQGTLTRKTTSDSFTYVAPAGKVLNNGRIIGDFVLSMEYSNGGVNANVHYYVWELSGAVYKYVEHPVPVIVAPFQPAGSVSSYGKTNGDSTDVSYGAFGLFKYEPYAFVEAAVNIDAILGGNCAGSGLNIKTIFVKTKASDAYNAALKDFVDPIPVSFHFGTESMNYGDGTFCKSEGTATPAKSGTGTFSASKYGTDSLSPGVVWVGGGNTSTSGVIDLSASAADTFVISYTFNSGGGCSGTQKDTIVINDALAGTIGNSQTICSGGDPATFTNTQSGSGGGVITYQWQSSTGTCGAGTFANVSSGGTGATYDPPSGLTTTTTYRRITISTVNGEACRDTSDCVAVTVNAITAGTIAADQTICSGGDPAAFTQSVAPTTVGALSYQWQKSTTDCSSGFSNIAGANSSTYDAPSPVNATTYYRRIDTSTLNGVKCTAITNCVAVTVNAITAGTIAASQTICSGGDPAAFTQSVAPTASGTLSFQWQKSTTDCSSGFSNIAGANSSTYDAPSPVNATTYYRRIDTSTLNGVKCMAITNCLTVTINAITAGTIAADQQICSGGDPAAFTQSVAPTASGALSYQWQKSTDNCSSGFSNIAGAISATYDPPSGLTTTSYYRRVDTSTLSGVKCTAITNCVTVTIKPLPGLPSITYHAPGCDDSTFSITVSNVTAGASYTLVDKNGNPIPDALPASPYVAPNSNAFDFTNIPAGSGYSVSVSSNGCGPAGIPTACGEPDGSVAGRISNTLITETTVQNTTVKAYPNPFNDNVKFIVTVPQAGYGSLELMNMQGQKVKTIYQGQIPAGGKTFEMTVPALHSSTLIYVLQMGDKQITGKLVQLNQ